MGMGKPIPPTLPNPKDYTVEFDETKDPMHPYNWKRSTKYVTLLSLVWTAKTLIIHHPKQAFYFYFGLQRDLFCLLDKRHLRPRDQKRQP